MRNILIGMVAPSLLGLAAHGAWAGEAASDDQWHFALTPYLWLPTINGKFVFPFESNTGGGASSVGSEIGPSDYLTNLNGVLMLAAELRHDAWALSGDLVYLDLSVDASTVNTVNGDDGFVLIPRDTNLDTETKLNGMVVSLAASHTLSESDRSRVAWLGGVRFLTLDTDLKWDLATTITGPGFTFAQSGVISSDMDVFDAIVGVRGKYWLGSGDHWYLPWYFDIGAGSSDLTWQAMAGGGYAFGRCDVLFVWRHLDYDLGDDDVARELSLGGPGVGFTWRF